MQSEVLTPGLQHTEALQDWKPELSNSAVHTQVAGLGRTTECSTGGLTFGIPATLNTQITTFEAMEH